jgi:hypothetical protein
VISGPWDRRLVPVIGALILVVPSAWYGYVRLSEELAAVSNQRRATMAETTRSRAAHMALTADRDFLMENSTRSQAMAAARFLDPQDRLRISTAVEALGVTHRLDRLQLRISPEEVISDQPDLVSGSVVVSTPVLITAETANDADMDEFLTAVPEQFNGVVVVETATLRRVTNGAGKSSVKARLELRWQTLRSPAEGADMAETER